MTLNLPKRINPCPIIDSIVEIRFKPNIHHSAVFGIIYSTLKDELKKIEDLPIMQLPEVLRQSDNELRFKPYYRVSNDHFVVQIGPEVFTISSYPQYIGWNDFSNKIFEYLERIMSVGVIDSVSRLGLRYINFFDEDIYNNVKLKVLHDNEDLKDNYKYFRTEINKGALNLTLQIANRQLYNQRNGSIVDIDIFTTDLVVLKDFGKVKEQLINEAHQVEKEFFYNLITEEFLKKFSPEY